MVIASTASPYKFMKSVMNAIDEEQYGTREEFDLAEDLECLSCTAIPKAVKELETGMKSYILRECDPDCMENMVKTILDF